MYSISTVSSASVEIAFRNSKKNKKIKIKK